MKNFTIFIIIAVVLTIIAKTAEHLIGVKELFLICVVIVMVTGVIVVPVLQIRQHQTRKKNGWYAARKRVLNSLK